MIPVSPVIPGQHLPEIIVAEHQDEYMNLPVVVFEGSVILSRWEMNEAEREVVARTGEIFVVLWTFGNPVPRVEFQISCPIAVDAAVDLEASMQPKTIYPGTDLPLLQDKDGLVSMLLKLTDDDRQIVSEKGDVYFFMHTEGKPITPSLLTVEKPVFEEVAFECISAVRKTEKSEKKASENNIEVETKNCSVCGLEVLVSTVLLDAVKNRPNASEVKILCWECGEGRFTEHHVLPETIRQLGDIIADKITKGSNPNFG